MRDDKDTPKPGPPQDPIISALLREAQRRIELDAAREPDADWHSYIDRLAASKDNPDLVGPTWVAPEERELSWTATRATITWLAPGGGLLEHLLVDTPERCTIGRSLSRDLVVWEPKVSRRHALLTAEGPDWWIEDTRSTNRTAIRRWSEQERRNITVVVEPQRREMLRDGDSLLLGTALLHFRDPDDSLRRYCQTELGDITPVMDERKGFVTATGLTSKQSGVLNVLCQPALDGGSWATNAEIATTLFIEVSTVRSHMRELYSRFRVPEDGLTREQRRSELVRRAIGGGWITPVTTDEPPAEKRAVSAPQGDATRTMVRHDENV